MFIKHWLLGEARVHSDDTTENVMERRPMLEGVWARGGQRSEGVWWEGGLSPNSQSLFFLISFLLVSKKEERDIKKSIMKDNH